MIRVTRKSKLLLSADFVCAARCYWLVVFPRVLREVRRRRALATRVPDPVLRRFALDALEHKGNNLEGAAAFAALVPRASRPAVVRALVACQAICDYLDLLCEQPTPDPVANGYRLHEALIVATTPGEPHRDYYAHHPSGEDGGYLRALVDGARTALSALPSLPSMSGSLLRTVERIATYQSFNHGDAHGSYEPFERWAEQANAPYDSMRPWETAAGAGSTLAMFALIAAAADPRSPGAVAQEIESAYFPWIGSLHSLLDSLLDYDEDIVSEGRALMGYYPSPLEAATRMHMIAGEALDRAAALPRGRRHKLIVAAMTSFYLCELSDSPSPHARLVAPSVLDAVGGLAAPTMAILSARRSMRGGRAGAVADAGASTGAEAARHVGGSASVPAPPRAVANRVGAS